MAAGKPVIGIQEGGLLETVGEGSGHPNEIRSARHSGEFHGVKKSVVSGQWSEGKRVRTEVGEGLLVTDCGVLMAKDPGVEDVIEAVEWMTPKRALGMRRGCEERAKRFDTNVFCKKMRDVIEGEV